MQRLKWLYFILYTLGILLGFSPLIIFEFRNNFYNLQTLILYLGNLNQTLPTKGNFTDYSHYFLTISLFSFAILLGIFKKNINYKIITILFIALFAYSFLLYLPTPFHPFRMKINWRYADEEITYSIIRKENIDNYNITNLGYDSLALVQKYLHSRDNKRLNFDNYKTNKFLFVINSDDNYMNNPAYEINTFRPSILINSWKINSLYNLYLLERIP